MKTGLSYAAFDLLHLGHVNMLEKLKAFGDRLVVGVSPNEFNRAKGKKSAYSYTEPARIVGALGCVDLVIPENDCSQKQKDIKINQELDNVLDKVKAMN
jgi:glycerol-3-phosphate cytidylyltransferase